VSEARFEISVLHKTSGQTLATIVKVAVSFAATVPLLKLTVPLEPTVGAATVQPGGALAETNVVLAGSGSEIVTVVKANVPFVSVIV
jgi:hypothetical protein